MVKETFELDSDSTLLHLGLFLVCQTAAELNK